MYSGMHVCSTRGHACRACLTTVCDCSLSCICGHQVMRMHVMENLRQRIEAGHGDYINELRVCTTVFCGIPSLQACAEKHWQLPTGLQHKLAVAQRSSSASVATWNNGKYSCPKSRHGMNRKWTAGAAMVWSVSRQPWTSCNECWNPLAGHFYRCPLTEPPLGGLHTWHTCTAAAAISIHFICSVW